jgi:hypothetical protein
MSFDIKYASDLAGEIAKQKEAAILVQLGDLITRGLLVVEYYGHPQLFCAEDSSQIIYKQSMRLVLKDKEYIEKLEDENRKMKERLSAIAEAMK